MSPIRLKLKQQREAIGMTQAHLAEQIGVRQATISDLERGKSSRLDLDLLDRLCAALDVQPGDLLERVVPAKRRRS